MSRKLFGWIDKSMQEPPSLGSPRDVDVNTWACLPTDIFIEIVLRLEYTTVVRCACVCKPWRRAIISNASIFRPCPNRFNPNLLVGLFHHIWNDAARVVSVTAVDTGHCERLSWRIPATYSGGVDLPLSQRILSSRDSFLLLKLRHGSSAEELCLCNPMTQDYTFLPLAPIMEDCEYTLITGAIDDPGGVRILAKAGRGVLCTEEDRLTYQVLSCGGGDGTGIWSPLQRSDEVYNGRRMNTHGRNVVVAGDAVHWLAGLRCTGCQFRMVTCTVGLDIDTGRAWVTALPTECQFSNTFTTPYVLTTSGNGRLSLLQPLPADRHIKVWVLDGDGDAMEWTVQHKIFVDVQTEPGDAILESHYSNLVCPRSGFLFITLLSGLLLRINLDRRARKPVQCIGKKGRYEYYAYETDWSSYVSKMKNF